MDIIRIEKGKAKFNIYINGEYLERCEFADANECGFSDWIHGFRGFDFYALEVKAEYELIHKDNGNVAIRFLKNEGCIHDNCRRSDG